MGGCRGGGGVPGVQTPPEKSQNIRFLDIVLYAYAIIGHTRANQLLPQLLMEQFETFPIQCRHIEHMHEGV